MISRWSSKISNDEKSRATLARLSCMSIPVYANVPSQTNHGSTMCVVTGTTYQCSSKISRQDAGRWPRLHCVAAFLRVVS